MATKARTAWKKAVKMYGVYLGGKLCAIRDTKIRALAAAWSVSDDAVVRAVLVTPAHKGKP